MIRIVIVDDHPVVADGIATNLQEAAADFNVVARGGSAADALAILKRERPDVLVLDLELPDRAGLDLLSDVGDVSPSTQTVIFSAYAGSERVARAFAAGVKSYVLKGMPSDELFAAIRAAAEGRRYLPETIAAQLAEAVGTPRGDRLTDREREILRLLAVGHPNKAIAAELGISERTVKYHVSEILARLGATNRAQAIVLAQRLGVL